MSSSTIFFFTFWIWHTSLQRHGPSIFIKDDLTICLVREALCKVARTRNMYIRLLQPTDHPCRPTALNLLSRYREVRLYRNTITVKRKCPNVARGRGNISVRFGFLREKYSHTVPRISWLSIGIEFHGTAVLGQPSGVLRTELSILTPGSQGFPPLLSALATLRAILVTHSSNSRYSREMFNSIFQSDCPSWFCSSYEKFYSRKVLHAKSLTA